VVAGNPIASLATRWTIASPRQRRRLLSLLFEKLWVKRAPGDATDRDPVEVIDTMCRAASTRWKSSDWSDCWSDWPVALRWKCQL